PVIRKGPAAPIETLLLHRCRRPPVSVAAAWSHFRQWAMMTPTATLNMYEARTPAANALQSNPQIMSTSPEGARDLPAIAARAPRAGGPAPRRAPHARFVGFRLFAPPPLGVGPHTGGPPSRGWCRPPPFGRRAFGGPPPGAAGGTRR